MSVFSRLRWKRARPAAAGPVASAEQLAEQAGVPLLIEAPGSALSGPPEGDRSAASLSRAQLATARELTASLASLTAGESPRTVFVSEGIESDDGVSPALALATASALDGRRTLLVEVDFNRRPLSVALELGEVPGIADYLNGAAHPQALLQALQLEGKAAANGADPGTPGPGTLVFIAAGEGSPNPMPPQTLDRFRHFLSKVRKGYQLVVLSGEPMLAPSDPGQLVPLVDATVICVRPGAVSREQAARAGQALHGWLPRTVGLLAATD